MKKFKYCYYVVYSYTKGDDNGVGAVCLSRVDPINTGIEIKKVSDYLKQANGMDIVIITNFIRLKAEK